MPGKPKQRPGKTIKKTSATTPRAVLKKTLLGLITLSALGQRSGTTRRNRVQNLLAPAHARYTLTHNPVAPVFSQYAPVHNPVHTSNNALKNKTPNMPNTKTKKRFSNYCRVSGNNYACKPGVYPRYKMAQINYKDPAFRAYLRGLGYSLSNAPEHITLDALSPLQTEMLGKKVRGISDAIRAKKYDPSNTPLLVALNGNGKPHIVNGHHRWAGASHAMQQIQKTKHRKNLTNTRQAIMAIRNTSGEERNAKQILNNVRAYPKATFAGL
jgi:hypothetical protein